ncbi:hypothetical protein ACFWUZ_19590 [Streptomyces sp. NPDC058646]|uniref:hypothetical protein n=1 Tax=Streptomyces sp. NPDC058646 TaxID=3346574 RepID=UPI003662CDE3
MAGDVPAGGQLDELAAFALEHAGGVLGDGAEGAGAPAVFLFADDVEDRYLYTFAGLDEARLHLADPAHGYVRCALAWGPAPDMLSVRAQEIGSSTSFQLTRPRAAGVPPEGDPVRTEGTEALLPGPGSVPVAGHGQAPGQLEGLEQLGHEVERAVDTGEGLAEAEDRLLGWVRRAGEADWEAAEEWVRGHLPADDREDPADDVLPAPEQDPAQVRTPGRYAITFRDGGAPAGGTAALAAWDQVARNAREILGPAATATCGGTALVDPESGVRLALEQSSGTYELWASVPDGTPPPAAALGQLYQLALTVQLETGRRAVDPQAGWYVDQGAGAQWARRFSLFARALRPFRRGPSS